MGGRAEAVLLQGTGGDKKVTGNELRRALGLKSDWFDITIPPPPTIEPRSIDTACPSGQPSGTFSDVAGDNPHRRAIDCVADHAIAQGTSAGRFSPALDRSEEHTSELQSLLRTS